MHGAQRTFHGFGLVGLLIAFQLATLLGATRPARANDDKRDVVPSAPAADAVDSHRDYPIPGGWFYSQESRMPSEDAPFAGPYHGYTVVDDASAAFWTGFRRFGGVAVLGYPLSRRYRYPAPDGYLQQAFQRGILQWRPEEGRAVLANTLDMFTEQGLDDVLEANGIPRPAPADRLGFADEVARRMPWISEPRFLARFFFDPVANQPFDSQEGAWEMLGLPQSEAVRLLYPLAKAGGSGAGPWQADFVAQRFQKGVLEMFYEDRQHDGTVVPGDGREGCVSLAAVGRLARRLGSGKIIANAALDVEPPTATRAAHIASFVPPVAAGDKTVQFEMLGAGFDPGKPVSIRLTPAADKGLAVITIRVPATDPDGSFDRLISARVTTYVMSVVAEQSTKTLDPEQDLTVDLTSATAFKVDSTRSTYC